MYTLTQNKIHCLTYTYTLTPMYTHTLADSVCLSYSLLSLPFQVKALIFCNEYGCLQSKETGCLSLTDYEETNNICLYVYRCGGFGDTVFLSPCWFAAEV